MGLDRITGPDLSIDSLSFNYTRTMHAYIQ